MRKHPEIQGCIMMGYPYAQGWRAIMTAERQRNNRRACLTVVAAVSVLSFFPLWAWLA